MQLNTVLKDLQAIDKTIQADNVEDKNRRKKVWLNQKLEEHYTITELSNYPIENLTNVTFILSILIL